MRALDGLQHASPRAPILDPDADISNWEEPMVSERRAQAQRIHAFVSRLQVIIGYASTASGDEVLQAFETLLPNIPSSSSRAEDLVVSGILADTLVHLCRVLNLEPLPQHRLFLVDAEKFGIELMRMRRQLIQRSKPFHIRQFEIVVTRRLTERGLTAAAVAKEMNLSVGHLLHLLKRHTGGGFRTYLNAVRLARAKELLTSTTLSVKEVAAANLTTAFGPFTG
jgi:AraC-like DNA-binding protein